MNRLQTRTAIKNELKRINRKIDRRIIAGYSYRSESRRHRALLRQLDRLKGARTLDVFQLF